MIHALALRDRLALAFALALVVAYGVIALCAVVIVDRAVTRAIDGRLATVAQAIYTIAGDEPDEIDKKDRQQFASVASDASGALVVAHDGRLVLGTSDAVPAWSVTAMRDDRNGRIYSAQFDRQPVRAIVQRRRTHHERNTIVVWQSMQIVRDLERTVTSVLGAFGLVVAAGGYFAGRQIARRGLLPLTRITAIVADIAAHDLARRVGPQPQADELGQLAATFDQMLDRLQSAFERQRRFTANASHDLRAPLATLRAEVDLALRRERTSAEYRAALHEIAIDADHLDYLIDALLAAARVDDGNLSLQPVDMGQIARRSALQIAPLAQAKNVRIDSDIASGCTILGEADLLERAVLAIVHNAVKFSPAGGSIDVQLQTDGKLVRLSVCDAGPGFTDVALAHAFDRFWRDDNARGRSGSGLGLAIAQGAVQRCGGTIVIDNAREQNRGARVVICFARHGNDGAQRIDRESVSARTTPP